MCETLPRGLVTTIAVQAGERTGGEGDGERGLEEERPETAGRS